MPSLTRALLCALSSLFFAQTLPAQTFTPRYNISIAPHSNGFYEYLPQGYNSNSDPYPVLLFVHGLGDNGNGSPAELPRLLLVGIPKLINEGKLPPSFDVNGSTQRFIIISPQFNQWPDVTDIQSAINYIVQNYRANINRIYLTGLSAGGGVSFDYPGASAANANRLAAIVPISNASGADRTKARVIAGANLPVWATHNLNDPSVNVSTTTWYINWINEAPAPNPLARSTIFNNNVHDAWTKTYDPSFTENGLNIYRWMLQYRRFQPMTGYRPIPAHIEAEDYAAMSGITSETSLDPGGSGYNIKSIDNGDWMNYNISVPSAGSYTLYLRVAATSAGSLQISSGSSILASTSVPNTGGTQNWTTLALPITLNAGNQTLRLQSNSGTFSLNWLEFTQGNLSINTIPSVNAGNDQTITGSGTLLAGSGTDNDGAIVSYQWIKVSGGNATIVSPNSPNTAITGMTGGLYSFRLQVTDNRGAIASDDITVNVNVAAGYTPLPARIQGETWASSSGVVIENCTDVDAGKDATYIEPNDWINYNVSTGAAGAFTIKLRVATLNTGGQLQVRKTDNTVLATITIPKTGGLQTWQTVSANLNLPAGLQTLRIFCSAKATPYMSLNWLEFAELVTGPNTPPVANAGTDQTITLPATVQLNGGNSQDPDGAITSYNWSFVSGPPLYTLSSASSPNPTLSNLAPGTYVFRLTVTDNGGASATDDVSVLVKAANLVPIASAGFDQTLTLPNNSAELDGSGSNDPEGGRLSYAWTKRSGPAAYSFSDAGIVNPTISGLTEGTYVLRLTVTDSAGASSFDEITVQVSSPPNIPPAAAAGQDQSIVLPINSVALDGTGSGDPDGQIVSWRWRKQSGPAGFTISDSTVANPLLSGLGAGTYIFRLIVTDDRGGTAWDEVSIEVTTPPNDAPVANAGEDIEIALPQNSISLDGAASTDDEDIVLYYWTKISGPSSFNIDNAMNKQPVISNLIAGTYVVRLTVTDNWGLSSSDEITITIDPDPQNQAPVADAGADRVILYPASSVQFDGSGSNDPDGSLVSVSWAKISGPSSYQLSNAGLLNPIVSNLAAGSYVFRLTVTDASGAIASDEVTIVVNRAPVANAGTDLSIQLPVSSAQLNGAASQDADGSISSRSWTKISGPSGYSFSDAGALNPTVSGLMAGSYVFRLTITDNWGASSYDEVTVTVNPSAPVTTKVQAESWASMSGVVTETTSDAGGGLNVGGINNGDWMNYTVNIGTSGIYTIRFRLASFYDGAKFDLRKTDGTVLATVNVPNTGGSQRWLNCYATVNLTAGTQTLRIQSTATADWKINWLEFIQGVPYVTIPAKIEGEAWDNMNGVRTETTADAGGGENVGWIDMNDWMDYNINAPSAGNYTLSLRLATMLSGGQLQVKKPDGTVLATVTVPNTTNAQKYQTVNAVIALAAGPQTIRIVSTKSPAWNFNWLSFAATSGSTRVIGSEAEAQTETPLLLQELQASPNPFDERLRVQVNLPGTGQLRLRLVDMGGKLVREVQARKENPASVLIDIETAGLPSGRYLVQAMLGDRSKTIVVVKK